MKAALSGKSGKEVFKQYDIVDFKAGAIRYSCKNTVLGNTVSTTWGLKLYVAFRWRGSAPTSNAVEGWQHLLGSLQQHYGTDASLDEASLREISGWLQVHAGTYKRVSEAPPQDRITKSAWFLRKHNAREVPPEVWTRPAVGGASNCAACHTQAADGRFSERDIKIPR